MIIHAHFFIKNHLLQKNLENELVNKSSLDDYSDNESMTKSANKAKTTKIDACKCRSTGKYFVI